MHGDRTSQPLEDLSRSHEWAPGVVPVDQTPRPGSSSIAMTATYSSVLVHIDSGDRCELRIDLATTIAREHGAYLCGLAATGLLTQSADVESNPCLYKQAATQRRQPYKLAVARFKQLAKKAGGRAFEGRVVDELPEYAVARASRYADLVIIAQSDPADPERTTTAMFPEKVLMDACRPLVIVPNGGNLKTIGTNVLMAWDDSRAVAFAVADALPMFTRVRRVRILRLNLPVDADALGSGEELSGFLLQHGVTTELHDDQTRLAAGDALLSRAANYGCDLLVMGAYGHSRLREAILGDTTRTILESTTVPVPTSRD